MTKNCESWTGLPKVPVTIEHVDRALRALRARRDGIDDLPDDITMEEAMIAGAIIAHMEAFDDRVGMQSLLMAVVHAVVGDYVADWACTSYGLELLAQPKAA